MRRSHVFFIFVSLSLAVILMLAAKSQHEISRFRPVMLELREITSALKLTDIAFLTDARYTRNPSQADIFSAFQDYPGSIEHFPSGSIIAPPDFTPLGTTLTVVRRQP